jgi:hypothetical protein
MLNQLPLSIKEIPVLYKFKRPLKAFLLDYCFYSIDEFLLSGAYPSSNNMCIYIYIYIYTSSIRIKRVNSGVVSATNWLYQLYFWFYFILV